MLYWIVMGALIVIALALFIVIITVVLKDRKNRDRSDEDEYDDEYEDEYDDEYDDEEYDEDEYDEEEADDDEYEYEKPNHFRPGSPSGGPEPIAPRRSTRQNAPVKKQWKIILENLDTWEKSSIIFYDNIGIGRSRTNSEFEKYMSVQDDPRVSKLHCAIIRKEDKLYLKDMGARNGTFLNGKMIKTPIVIQKDDIIGVGGTKIEVKKILRERD